MQLPRLLPLSPIVVPIVHSDFFQLPLELQIEYLPCLSELYKRVFREKLGRLGQQMAVAQAPRRPTIAVFRSSIASSHSS